MREYGQVSVLQSNESTDTIEHYKPAAQGPGLVVDADARNVLPAQSSVEDVATELSKLVTENGDR